MLLFHGDYWAVVLLLPKTVLNRIIFCGHFRMSSQVVVKTHAPDGLRAVENRAPVPHGVQTELTRVWSQSLRVRDLASFGELEHGQ